MIGRPLTAADINATAAELAGQLFRVTDDIAKLKAVMDGYTSADLESQFGFVQGDADALISALADMGEVAAYFQGTEVGTQKDRRLFARRLLGTGVY